MFLDFEQFSHLFVTFSYFFIFDFFLHFFHFYTFCTTLSHLHYTLSLYTCGTCCTCCTACTLHLRNLAPRTLHLALCTFLFALRTSHFVHRTPHRTARTFFSVFWFLTVLVVFCTCQSLFHMHNMCLWLKAKAQGPRGSRCFLRALSKPFHPHAMSLLGVPSLSSFCSTPPPATLQPQLRAQTSVSPSKVSTRSISSRPRNSASTLRMTWPSQPPRMLDHLRQRSAASGSPHSVASTVTTLLNLRLLSRSGKLVQGHGSVASSFSKRWETSVLGNEFVASDEECASRGKWDRDLNSVPTLSYRQHLHDYLERKAGLAVRGESAARKRLTEAEPEMEIRRRELKSSEMALYEPHRELESQKLQLDLANDWADQPQREKINLCGGLDLRNRLYQESQVRTCHQIEALRRTCCEETSRVRELKIDEFCNKRGLLLLWVDFLTHMQDLQNKVISLSDAREFHDPETASRSGASHVLRQTLAIPSPRGTPGRDSGLPPTARNTMGTSGNVFWKLTCSRRTTLSSFRKFKEFCIIFSRIESWYYRKHYGTGERNETSAAQFVSTCTMHPKRSWNFGSYWWNFFSQWHDGLPEISPLRNASWNIPRLFGISKLESQLQDWSYAQNQQILNALDQRSFDSKVNWRIDDIAIGCGKNRFCPITICLMRWLRLHWRIFRQACALPKKSKCRRATRSKMRPTLTMEANRLHDLWACSCNRSLRSSAASTSFFYHTLAKWRRPRFPCTMEPSSVISNWDTCRNGLGRIVKVEISRFSLFNFRLHWFCMTKKLFETKGNRGYYLGEHDYRFDVVRFYFFELKNVITVVITVI